MLQLNLLPDVKKELLHAKRMRSLVMTICIFVSIGAGGLTLLLGLGMGALAIQKSVISGDVDKNIAKIESERDGNRLDEYLSVQNDLSQINTVKENQPQASRVFDYLDVIFGRTTPIAGLHWSDWQGIKISAVNGASDGIAIELTGQSDTAESRMMLRNRLYFAKMKYSEYLADGSGKVTEGETKTDQKLFPGMIPTVNFEGGIQDETTGRWPFTAKLVFNPIALSIKYRIQAIEIDSCDVWSATFGTIGEGCESKSVSGLNNPTNNPGDINGGGTQ